MQLSISAASTAIALLALASAQPASATPFFFSTGNPDGKIATAARPDAGGNFEIESVEFFGGPGCAFILNGMIFRIPLRVKSFTAPLLLKAEAAWNRLPWRGCHFLFVARWKRT